MANQTYPRREEEREAREWWCVTEGRICKAIGYDCKPLNPESWWFPSLGWSMQEGFHVFPTEEEARQKCIAELIDERDQINRKLEALRG